jgi:DNA-damage-inducible protein J
MATIQINIDDALKTDIEGLLGSLGLDTQTAVNIFFHATLAHGGIPFAVRRPNFKDEVLEAIEEMENGGGYGPYKTVDEAMAAMLED